MKLDMHCHTKEGSIDGQITVEECIEMLKSKGYGGMLITDHNSYKAYRHWKKTIKGVKHTDFVVLKGVEYDTIDCGHILVIFPRVVKLPILEFRGLPVALLIEIVHHNGGILGPAHPCGEKYLSLTNTRRGRKYKDMIEKFDFIETFNACESEESNHKAETLARMYGKPGIGGSDSHRASCVGLAYTEIDEDIQDETDFINYLKSGKPIRCGGELYNHTAKQKIGPLNKILVYSFWFYNKGLAFVKIRKRRGEMTKNDYKRLRRRVS